MGVVHFRESTYDYMTQEPRTQGWPWPIAMLDRDWSQRLLVGTSLSSARWMLYDLRGHLDEEGGTARLSWVYGDLNREKGLLQIKTDGFELMLPDEVGDETVPGLVYLTKVPEPEPEVEEEDEEDEEEAAEEERDGLTDAAPAVDRSAIMRP
jgi:hypothetical protein